jgi:hypothetical protein
MALQSTGALVVSAWTNLGQDDGAFHVLRFTPGGQLDATFGDRGETRTAFPYAAADPGGLDVLPGDALLVAGNVREVTDAGAFNGFGVARYLANGQLDTTLASGGQIVTPLPGAPGAWGDLAMQALQPDGKLVVATAAHASSGAIALLNLARYRCE